MTDISSLDSSLPWHWIIEYLSSFKQVDTSVLHDLIERSPDLPDDLVKHAKERFALRRLEELFHPLDRFNCDVIPDSRISFDLSKSCEDVLKCILLESCKSSASLENTRPELLRWNIYPFIMHKRATMPKCALEELKDTILNRSGPEAAVLKEISGLVHDINNQPHGVTVHNDHPDAFAARCGLRGRSSNVEAVPEKSNMVPPVLREGSRKSQHDLSKRNLLPSKRCSSSLATENLEGLHIYNKDGLLGAGNLPFNAKKLNQSILLANRQRLLKDANDMVGQSSSKIVSANGMQQNTNPSVAKADTFRQERG
ncbi:hypothetical protein SLEP1_g2834 [Rubroshorea leprosula]|nr:hypothetical protein SLEP1_g2834 [Rubroshorea leprosula]